MNFTDNVFVLFFAAVFALYYLPPLRRLQVWILVGGSLLFYAAEAPILLFLLLASCTICAVCSYYCIKFQNPWVRSLWAGAGVAINLGLLGFFKYKFLFFSPDTIGPGTMASPESLIKTLLLLPLPIGISFYTFHGISLLVDSLRRNESFFQAYDKDFRTHYLDTVLYLAFFPQLVAGPIMKAKDFLPQIAIKRFADIDWDSAIRCLILGYFLKVVIANNLQDQTFFMQAPYFRGLSSINLLFLLFGYSAQIFADFAGYSLIAIGLAKLLGYRLPDNFNFPYISQSIAEFWRRWHMSLSSWLRDYLYIPLGGSRHGRYRTYANLLIVMTLGGLWHGAAWSFAVWGIWHGLGLAVERPLLKTWLYTTDNRIAALLKMLGVFVFVSLGWLLFKLTHFSDAIDYFRAIGGNSSLPIGSLAVGLVILYSLPVLIWHIHYLWRPRVLVQFRILIYSAMVFLIAMNPGRKAAFIYFQF